MGGGRNGRSAHWEGALICNHDGTNGRRAHWEGALVCNHDGTNQQSADLHEGLEDDFHPSVARDDAQRAEDSQRAQRAEHCELWQDLGENVADGD